MRDNVIEAVGPSETLFPTADTVIDLRDHVVLPGLINTHHHLWPEPDPRHRPDADLFTWLKTLSHLGQPDRRGCLRRYTITGLAELAPSGCTTSSDHLYIFPNDCTLDSQIRAAADIGVLPRRARLYVPWAKAGAVCRPTV